MAAEQNIETTSDGTPRRLIIHCGVQKTASTSLHHFVGRNRVALSSHLDIRTPAKGSATRDLGRMAMQYSLNPSAERAKQLSEVVRTVRDQVLGGSGTVLISHENLPGSMIGKGGVVTLYPNLEKIIDLLNENLAPYQPEYVFYTRDMPTWKRSVHNQAVNSDHYLHGFTKFLDESANCGTWDDLKQRLEAHLGPDRVRLFRLEDETDEGRPGTQLLRFAGLSANDIAALDPKPRRSSQSLGAGALEFMRQLNELGLDRKTRALVADLVRANPSLFKTGSA